MTHKFKFILLIIFTLIIALKAGVFYVLLNVIFENIIKF